MQPQKSEYILQLASANVSSADIASGYFSEDLVESAISHNVDNINI